MLKLALLGFLRPVRMAGLALLLGAGVAAYSYWPWITAEARTVVVLSTTYEAPVLDWAATKLTDEPRVRETRIAGIPATVTRPGSGDGPWPAIVFINGATSKGRYEPEVRDLARGLARAGYLVAVPDPPGLSDGQLSEQTLSAMVGAVKAIADRSDVRDGRISLVGASLGATLALLAAEDKQLSKRVSLVAGVSPYTDLREVLRLATTGYQRERGVLRRYDADPFLSVVAARSLAVWLPSGPDRDLLIDELRALDGEHPQPLTALRDMPMQGLGVDAKAVVKLLANRNPDRFDDLYRALPEDLRGAIARLSPITRAQRLQAPVELASAPKPRLVPLTHSEALVLAAPDARLTVNEAFAQPVPRPSLTSPDDILSVNAWVVRALRAAHS